MAPCTAYPGYDWVECPPIVVPFHDRNGDGRIDVADGGDVIVQALSGPRREAAYIRVLDGRTGEDLWTFDEPYVGGNVGSSIAPAAGDVDGDGYPEIVVADSGSGSHHLIMYNWDGTVRWYSPVRIDWVSGTLRGSLSLADLDGDGTSEILASNAILNADGTLRTLLDVPPCRESYPLDMDLDGVAEIVCGVNVARQDGTVDFLFWDNGYGISGPAQLDADPQPELLVFLGGDAPFMAVDDDGTALWRVGGGAAGNGSSQPIADVDGDGLSDMVGGEGGPPGIPTYVVAMGGTGREIWRTESLDEDPEGGTLANLTGPLAYLHDDAFAFRVLDAATGGDVFTLDNFNTTVFEADPFVDLDGDGRGELLTTSSDGPPTALRAWRDDSWCDARPIWSQHAFAPVYIGDDLHPAGPPTTPIDWLSVGFRKQVNGCTCLVAPTVDVVVSPGCGPDVACVATQITGGTGPFSHEWTLPDGTTSREPSPCFAVTSSAPVSVAVSDSRTCLVQADAVVDPPPPRSLGIALAPECGSDVQCATAVSVGLVGPLVPEWTLPDGTTSTEESPCFPVTGPGTLALVATDADGCPWAAEVPVDVFVPPSPVELSSAASGMPLRVAKVPGTVRGTWEPLTTGLDHALLAGTLGAWTSHAAVACARDAPGSLDPTPSGNRYYLAGEVTCDGTWGPLGADSAGAARAVPATGCP